MDDILAGADGSARSFTKLILVADKNKARNLPASMTTFDAHRPQLVLEY
jgi:hypothetical protein